MDAQDILQTRSNPRPFFDPATLETLHDFSRDQRVDAVDTLLARTNQTWSLSELRLIDLSGSKAAKEKTLPERLTWPRQFEQADRSGRPTPAGRQSTVAVDTLLARGWL